MSFKATLYSMLSFQGWWRQCTRSYLEAASTHDCWRQHHSVTALAMYTITLVTTWIPWRRNVDLLVLAGTSTHLNWIHCGFKHIRMINSASKCLKNKITLKEQIFKNQKNIFPKNSSWGGISLLESFEGVLIPHPPLAETLTGTRICTPHKNNEEDD
jgi:hypothetical protein